MIRQLQKQLKERGGLFGPMVSVPHGGECHEVHEVLGHVNAWWRALTSKLSRKQRARMRPGLSMTFQVPPLVTLTSQSPPPKGSRAFQIAPQAWRPVSMR